MQIGCDTFLKALGKNIGASKCEDDKIELAKELLEETGYVSS